MKKITEQQLIESARALRDYTDILEASSPYQEGVADFIGTGASQVANAWNAASNAISGFGSDVKKAYQAGVAPQPTSGTAAQPAGKKWPTTPVEIIAFQKANKLTPDGKIGANTMKALQTAGYQPPHGFVPVANKAAAPTQRPQQPAGPTQADQDEFMAANAADRAQYQADKAPQQQAAAQSAAPVPGMQQGQAQAKSALTPNFQSGTVQESIRDTLEKLDELNLSQVGKAGAAFARGLANRTNPQVMKKGEQFAPTSALQKDANKLGREVNKNAAATALGGAGVGAGMMGTDSDTTGNLQPNELQKPAGYYTDKAASDRMVKATADAGRNALSKPMTGDKVEPSEIHTIQQPSVQNDKLTSQQKDPKVEKLQQDLVSKGYDIAVDGVMGQDTKNALMHYQEFGPGGASQIQEHVTFGPIDSLARIVQLSRI